MKFETKISGTKVAEYGGKVEFFSLMPAMKLKLMLQKKNTKNKWATTYFFCAFLYIDKSNSNML